MATCYQKHPFEIEAEDRLTTINTKIFEIKKKIQLSEGQRKSHFEESEAEKQQNSDLIDTLKKEIRLRAQELTAARAAVAEETAAKYLSEVCPVGTKSSDQIISNLDLKVIEQRKILDLLKYERRSKKMKLRELEKEYEQLLIATTSRVIKTKSSPTRKHASHLENEIHKVLIQWTEAELVKKKYYSIKQALMDDSVKFESSLSRIEDLLMKQKEEIAKLELVREEAAEMRARASAAAAAEAARAHDAEHARASERAFYAQRFDERRRELEKLEKRIFPPQVRTMVRQESIRSTEAAAITEEASATVQMEIIFQRLMKLTGVTEAEEVFDRFRAQRETSQRLNYLQSSIEEEKLQLESTQTSLLAELEAFKFASVKDKDETQDQIAALKEEIQVEVDAQAQLDHELEELDSLLLEIKRLLYELCKLLDVIPDPPVPDWTAEARDVQEILRVLRARFERAGARAADVRARRDVSTMAMPSNPTSGAPSVGGLSMQSHSTPKEAEAAVPTYKELLTKEPVRPPQYPPAQRLESMQPSLYAPRVDVTRAQLGFGRVGLRQINRDLHSKDPLTQLQAIHSVMDMVQISENAMFLINIHAVYRLIDLMEDRNPVIREKICLILTHLAGYYQGRQRIMSRPAIIAKLMALIMRDRKEIRYAAAYTLRTLTRDRCACELICQVPDIIKNLLKMVKSDYTGIVNLHLKTLANLFEWDPAVPLKANAFQVMLTLFKDVDPRIISGAMDCMVQLCKHRVGKRLADEYDITFVLRPFMRHKSIEVVISTIGLMCYTTLTTRSKWRAKEACMDLTRYLTFLCHVPNMPLLQLRSMQVLINLCDCPDIRNYIKLTWEKKIKLIMIRTHEEWDGTTETTTQGLETGHNYRTMCIENVETIKNEYGDNAAVVNVHSYLRRLQEKKDQLIAAINWKCFS